MAEAVAGSLIDAVFQSMIEGAKKEIKYVREYNTYVQNLREELQNLENARVDVQRDAEEAENNGENIKEAVTKWIDEVKSTTEEAEAFLKENDKSKKSCFPGVSPNPSTRFRMSKKAEQIIESISKLKEKKNQWGKISYRSAPLGRVTGTYTGANYHVTKSREDLLKKINKVLMDSTVRIVGVSGPSGVGKSVLMKQVEKQVSERKHGYDFEQVTLVTVGQAPNLEKIQDDIAYRLGLKFENENGVEHKARRLSERLRQKKKTLMIFDDLWKNLDLHELGILEGDDYSHIKILLTSKSKEMLMNHMNSKPNLSLEPLEKEEALELFETLAGCYMKDKSKELLQKQLIEICVGLPVFIVPLATELKRHSPSTWNDALKKLKRSDSVGMEKVIEETLGINYQVINAGEVKALFLLCGQIGQQIIHIDDLLIYGMGMGFLEGVTIEECRERLQTLLGSLKSNGLLEEEGSHHIKIHDLVSKVSLSIAKKDHHSLVLRNKESLNDCSEDELKRCGSISFPYADDIHKLHEGLIRPELNMLLLYTRHCPLNLPNSFFNGMKKLKVMDLSGVVLTVLPSSIELLHELHTLCLHQCKIEDLTNIGKLMQLQMLTFRGSGISRLPKEIGLLIHLRLLSLENCHRLEVIEPGVLGSLNNLEELVLPESFNRWEAIGVTNASLNELSNMSCLTSLRIHIPEVDALPCDLPFGNLKRHKILIGDQSDCFIEYDEERTLVLKLNSDDTKIIWEDWVQTTLQRAQKISLLGWGGIEKSVIKLSKGGFLELKHIDLQYSPRIQYIFRPIERFQFSLVESLYLYKLINLEKIYQGSLTRDSFSNLKSIRITACHKLSNLFSISLAKEFSRIEEIMVENCKMISEIITFDSVDDSLEHKGGTTDNKPVLMKFNRLRSLKLSSLPEILSFCATTKENMTTSKDDESSQIVFLNGQQVSFPYLESLILSELPLLEKISHSKHPIKLHRLRNLKVEACEKLSNVIDSQLLLQLESLEQLTIEKCQSMETVFDLDKLTTHEATKSLKQLQVSGCEGLKYLFSSSMANLLQSITHVSISDCKTMEKMFVEEKKDTDDTRDNAVFSSLTELLISKMESLTIFASGSHCLDFPCLKKIEVRDCPNMSTFVPSKKENKLSRKGTFSKIEKILSRKSITQNDGSGTDESFFFSAKTTLPSLEKLVLSTLESLTNIWESSLPKDSFCKLASMEIKQCEKLQTVFPLALMGTMQNLAELKVENCNALEVLFESGERDLMMYNLSSLESLKNIWESSLPKDSLCKLASMEIKQCEKLQTIFPLALMGRLQNLAELKVENCNALEVLFESSERDLMMNNLSSLESLTNIWESSLPKDSLCKLASMEIKQCEKLQTVFPLALMGRLQNLAELKVENCNALEVLFESGERDLMMYKLKDMLLQRLPNLKHLVMIRSSSRKAVLGFPNLIDMKLNQCDGLIDLFPIATARTLFELENLEITSCSSMVEVFSAVEEDEEVASLEEMAFSSLCFLKLKALDSLTSFCSGRAKHYFPFLKELSIIRCTKLKAFILKPPNEDESRPLFDEKVIFPNLQKLQIEGLNLNTIWHNKLPANVFRKLKFLVVEQCDELSVLIPSFMMNNLQSLESLIVTMCNSLEVIFELEGHTSKDQKLAKSRSWKLKSIKLSQLPNLKCICKSAFFSKNFLFHELVSLEVRSCKSMEQVIESRNDGHTEGFKKIIFSHLSSFKLFELPTLITFCAKHTTEWPVLQVLQITDCNAVEALIADSEQHFIPLFLMEKVAFPKIESLIVSKMSNLKDLWSTNKEGKGSKCSSDAFCNLKILQVDDCNRLSTISSFKLIRGFQN